MYKTRRTLHAPGARCSERSVREICRFANNPVVACHFVSVLVVLPHSSPSKLLKTCFVRQGTFFIHIWFSFLFEAGLHCFYYSILDLVFRAAKRWKINSATISFASTFVEDYWIVLKHLKSLREPKINEFPVETFSYMCHVAHFIVT